MARAISGGTISFGLVSIPVQLYSATQASSGVSFNLLHTKCGGRVKQQYICPQDNNEIVPRDQMVKGYEFAKDQYVTFTPDELKAMEEKATQTIDIAQFVPIDRVDPVYYDKAYYLGPEKGGEKAYRLLAEVMRETKRAAVARYAARGKQYIVMLRAADGAQGGTGIVMQTLLYADEVRSISEVPIGDATIREGEMNLARQLVDQIATETFNPNDYEDEVKKRIQADIQRKVEGKEIAAAPVEEQPARVIDLMEALKASLAGKAKAQAKQQQGRATAAATSDDDADASETPPAGGIATRKPARRATAAPATKSDTGADAGSAERRPERKRAGKR